jgi:hypothetical protein
VINDRPIRDLLIRRNAVSGLVLLLFSAATLSAQNTGTFIDRHAPADLRVVTYNVLFDSIFEEENPVLAAKFARVMTALQPEVVNLQEISAYTAADVVSLMNSIVPPGAGATWYGYKSSDNVIVSKYPLTMQRSNTSPPNWRGIALALVDLPNDQFATDLYLMNNHFKCCGNPGGPEDTLRQQQADALVNWMRDARTPGGFIDLPADTPMAVVGDLNIVGLPDPLNNLLTGNIVNNETYGADSPPDWDGTNLIDLHPLHNGIGPEDYTWRNDNDIFDPGRLDFVLYTDSVARAANNFVLNTVTMTPAELVATGLQTYDVTIDELNYDHLPIVVDFRFPADGEPGDYNLDRVVDAGDYELWQQTYGASSIQHADGNKNNAVDAADYVLWRKMVSAGGAAATDANGFAVPEPASYLLLAAAICLFSILRMPTANHGAMSWTRTRSLPH